MKTEGYSDRQDNAHYTEYLPKLSELTYCLCIPKYGQLHATRGGLRTRLSKHNTGRHSSCHGSLPGRGQHNAAHDAGIDPRGVSAVTRHPWHIELAVELETRESDRRPDKIEAERVMLERLSENPQQQPKSKRVIGKTRVEPAAGGWNSLHRQRFLQHIMHVVSIVQDTTGQ